MGLGCAEVLDKPPLQTDPDVIWEVRQEGLCFRADCQAAPGCLLVVLVLVGLAVELEEFDKYKM